MVEINSNNGFNPISPVWTEGEESNLSRVIYK
jgi:hypothetical protein